MSQDIDSETLITLREVGIVAFSILAATTIVNACLITWLENDQKAKGRKPVSSMVKTVLILVPMSSVVRCVWFVLVDPAQMVGAVSLSDITLAALDALPGYLFFTCYSLLALVWVVLALSARKKKGKNLDWVIYGRVVVAIINTGVYIIWVVLLLLAKFSKDSSDRLTYYFNEEMVYGGTLIIFPLVSSILGWRMRSYLKAIPVASNRSSKEKRSRKVAALAVGISVVIIIIGISTITDAGIMYTSISVSMRFSFITWMTGIIIEWISEWIIVVILSPYLVKWKEKQPLLSPTESVVSS